MSSHSEDSGLDKPSVVQDCSAIGVAGGVVRGFFLARARATKPDCRCGATAARGVTARGTDIVPAGGASACSGSLEGWGDQSGLQYRRWGLHNAVTRQPGALARMCGAMTAQRTRNRHYVKGREQGRDRPAQSDGLPLLSEELLHRRYSESSIRCGGYLSPVLARSFYPEAILLEKVVYHC